MTPDCRAQPSFPPCAGPVRFSTSIDMAGSWFFERSIHLILPEACFFLLLSQILDRYGSLNTGQGWGNYSSFESSYLEMCVGKAITSLSTCQSSPPLFRMNAIARNVTFPIRASSAVKV